MKLGRVTAALTLLLSMLVLVPGASGAPPAGSARGLEMYRAEISAARYRELAEAGYDITLVEPAGRRVEVGLVLSRAQRERLDAQGVDLRVWRDAQGRTQAERAAQQRADGFRVWRPYDGDNGIAAELRRLAARNPRIAELHTLGTTHQGREILAIRLTKNVRGTAPGAKPAVLYQGTTHAREWISTEVARRLLRWYVRGSGDVPVVDRVLRTTELWFIPVVNPDGYQYTFDAERLWRKNLRDNNRNGEIDFFDGVDLNRNYPEHWNYDEEGSSSQFSDQTYRGPAPASEPETQADMSLFDMADFKFAISYHSFGPLLLYPQGWQVQTPSADDPIYVALTGTDFRPAVRGFDPDVSA